MDNTNFFDSPRIFKALDLMRKGKTDLESLEITKEEIAQLVDLGINIIKLPNADVYYIDSSSESMFEIISLKRKKKSLVRWVEIGALFAGHRTFDQKALEELLQEAVNRGYSLVCFSGDLCAGPPPKTKNGGRSEWTFWTHERSVDQAELIVSILKKFPTLTYYAINGANEIAFEKGKQMNPLILVQRDLKAEDINFIYKPTSTLNLIVEGVVHRIVYLKKRRSYTVSYQSEFYMDEQYAKMVDNVVIKGKSYKLMFVQFGGAMENSLNKNGSGKNPVYMTTNSGFIRDTVGEFHSATTYPSIRFCDAWIQNGTLAETFKTCICVR